MELLRQVLILYLVNLVFTTFLKIWVHLDTFFRNVADNLKDGGKFIGTCFDGKAIYKDLIGKNELSFYDSKIKHLFGK